MVVVWRLKKECRSTNQNRGRVWVSVEQVWTCLNMFELVDSRTIEQVFARVIRMYLVLFSTIVQLSFEGDGE